MITVDHLRQFGILKRQIKAAKEIAQKQAEHMEELEKAMEHLAYQIIKDNR